MTTAVGTVLTPELVGRGMAVRVTIFVDTAVDGGVPADAGDLLGVLVVTKAITMPAATNAPTICQRRFLCDDLDAACDEGSGVSGWSDDGGSVT